MTTLIENRGLAAYWREGAMIALAVLSLAALLVAGPIPQYADYYRLADGRSFLGIPNVVNVFSNVPFLLVGAAGMVHCRRSEYSCARASWLVLFAGMVLVCFGSGYFHWDPNDATLAWDRLPMTFVLAGLVAALVSEQFDLRHERYILLPAIVVGAISVGWWYRTGDLRLYIWVQAIPLLAIAVLFVLFRATYTHRRYLVYGLGLYLLAKVAEYYDREVFSFTGNMLSGHSLKHLLAAAAMFLVYLMLRRRRAFGAA